MEIQTILSAQNIIPDPLKDQFFLIDKKLIVKIVDFADLSGKDTVLEIGTGIGNLTAEIAKKAGTVIAFEIDPRFKPFLEKLPGNVEVHFEDAWDYVQLHGKFRQKREFNKIVSNPPFSFCEKWLHNLTLLDYEKAILLVPLGFVSVVNCHPIFSSFFEAKILLTVKKDQFYPVPKTNCAVIDLIKLPDPVAEKNLPRFLRQYIYQREDQKVKNSLREGLIDFAKLALNNKISKNRAEQILEKNFTDKTLLEQKPIDSETYDQISRCFSATLLI